MMTSTLANSAPSLFSLEFSLNFKTCWDMVYHMSLWLLCTAILPFSSVTRTEASTLKMCNSLHLHCSIISLTVFIWKIMLILCLFLAPLAAGETYSTFQHAALKKWALLCMLPLVKRAGVQGTALQWKARSAVSSVTWMFQNSNDKAVLPLVKCHRNSRG